MQGYGKTYSKIILVGEHAVVHGMPSIAIPFKGFYTEVKVSYIDGLNQIETNNYQGLLKEDSNEVYGIYRLVKYVNEYLNVANQNLMFKINSTILAERGLGSSASISISIIKAMFNYYNKPLNNELLIKLALYAENYYHQNTSGIDVYVLVNNKPVFFIKDKELKVIDINLKGSIIVVDSNIMSKTKEAVSNVLKSLNSNYQYINEQFLNIEKIAYETLETLKTNQINRLGNLLNLNHEHLKNIGVSSQVLNEIKDELINLGALGAKLTGGGIGGCVIALAKNSSDAKYIQNNLKGYKSYIYNLGE